LVGGEEGAARFQKDCLFSWTFEERKKGGGRAKAEDSQLSRGSIVQSSSESNSGVGAGSELGGGGGDDGSGSGGQGSTENEEGKEPISEERGIRSEVREKAHATTAPPASTVETAPPIEKASFL